MNRLLYTLFSVALMTISYQAHAVKNKWKQVKSGSNHSCAISIEGEIQCWGDNSQGQLGYGDTNHRGDDPSELIHEFPFVDLGTDRNGKLTVKSLALGQHHTCALLSNKQIKCWGDNSQGQLGYEGKVRPIGDSENEMGNNLLFVDLGTDSRGNPWEVETIAAGGRHTCALLANKQAKCWGRNRNAQLGYGDKKSRGKAARTMGNNLDFVDLGTENGRPLSIKAFALGQYHSCALFHNKKSKCWGENIHGQLGYGDTKIRGNQPSSMSNNLLFLDLGMEKGSPISIVALVSGDHHVCALFSKNRMKCWGVNWHGQLGYGDKRPRGRRTTDMGKNLPFVELGGSAPIAITAGDNHTCALFSNRQIKCWGENQYGQLGYQDPSDKGIKPNEMGEKLPFLSLLTEEGRFSADKPQKALSITAGRSHTCVRLPNGTLRCWGKNNVGQLGLGVSTLPDQQRQPE